jgi:putative peptidoglycan lipid II flippase
MSNDKLTHEDSRRSLIKSTGILSAGTLSSRILGFVRDMIFARVLGTLPAADAFFVAWKIPNLFRDLVGEGAVNSAVIPVFSEYRAQKDRLSFWRFVSVLLLVALLILTILTLTGMLLAPWIVRLMAPGFMSHPGKLDLAIRLTRLMFPYLVLIGLTAYSMAILFTFRQFVVPAFTPCLMNMAIIISALVSTRFLPEPVHGLAWGVLWGGILQAVFQVRPLLKAGFQFVLPQGLRHPGVAQVGHLLLPRLFGAGVYQLTVFIDTFCASLSHIVGVGGISAVYYANRILQFPMGVFGFALASAVLPTLSGLARKKDIEQLKKTVVFALENILFILCPLSIIMMILAQPIIRVLFERGEFTAYSTSITSFALMFYAMGLFSFGGVKILAAAFHALQDTATPVKVAGGCLLLNAGLNVILMFPLRVGGIALASSFAAAVNFFALLYLLDKRLGGFPVDLRKFVDKIFCATLITGGMVYLLWRFLPVRYECAKLVLVGGLGMAGYGGLCYFLKIEQAHKIGTWGKSLIPRKKKRS